MAKKKDKTTESIAPDLGTLTGWLTAAKDASRKRNWEYFVIDQYLRGNQSIQVNPSENTIEVKRTSDDISFPINKMYANFRATRAYVIRNKPKVEVTPDDFSDEAKRTARRQTAILRRDNRINNARKLNKEWVYYGVKYGAGYRKIGYDQKRHAAIRWTIDPFDMLFGSRTGNFEDAPYIINPIVRTLKYWHNKYPDKADLFTADNKLAEDEYKQLSLQIESYDNTGNGQPSNEQTAIGYEAWYRVFEPNSLGGLINKCLFTSSGVVKEEETPFNEYPFIQYCPEIVPNELNGHTHMKHLIAPQRLLNALNQDVVEYNFLVNKGRYQFPKGSGFEVIKSRHGQLIRHNMGRTVQSVPVAPLNPIMQWQIQYADDALQLIGAQNDATLGKSPFAGASGDMVEALQSGDANSLSEYRENFEDALEREAQMILTMYDLFEGEGFMVADEINKDEVDNFFAIGKTAAQATGKVPGEDGKIFIEDNGSYLDYMGITADNNVKVTLTSELGETQGARLNFLSKLVELGLPLSFLLKNLEFPDIDDIEQRIAEETVVEMMKEQAVQPQPGQMPAQGGQPQVDVQAEEARIKQLIAQGGAQG